MSANLSATERTALRELFKTHNIKIIDLSQLTGKTAANITGWLRGYSYIGSDARQAIVDYAESLSQEAADEPTAG